jgi:hypothetical protein
MTARGSDGVWTTLVLPISNTVGVSLLIIGLLFVVCKSCREKQAYTFIMKIIGLAIIQCSCRLV